MYYPTLKLSTNVVSGFGGASEFEITCTSVTCAGSCQPPGEVATCQGLMLVRKQIDGNQRDVVSRARHLEPMWAGILDNLKILVDEESKMVIRIPKTHTFVGQYQCGCESTDASKIVVLSNPTAFEKIDFLSEAIFQRRYTVDYEGIGQDLLDGSQGVIELVTEGRGGFFLMAARGITLAQNVITNVEWTENGRRTAKKDHYSQEDIVRLYPDIEALANWTISANRVVPLDLYPDAKDNETVIYQWGLPNQRPDFFITDVFHIIDVDKTPFQPVRAWVVSKTDRLLHILAYYQHSDSRGYVIKGEVEVNLLSSGCDRDAEPNLVATFVLSGKEVKVNSIPDRSKVDFLTYGLGVNIVLKDYSAFYGYKLQAVVEGDRTTLLDVVQSKDVHPKDVLKDAQFDVALTNFSTTATHDDVRLELRVKPQSPALLNYLKCVTGRLKLTPVWNPKDEQEALLQLEPSQLEFIAPKSLKRLNFQIELMIEKETKSIEMEVANPYLEEIKIAFNETTGLLSWDSVPPELSEAIKEYEVMVSVDDIGCGTTTNLTLNNLAAFTCTKARGCSTNLWTVEKLLSVMDILMNYTISITPKYFSFGADEPTFGKSSILRFTHGAVGHSVIHFEAENASPRTHTISLQPFRKTPCENTKVGDLDAIFELTAYAILAQGKIEMPLEGVEYRKLSSSNYGVGGVYEVSNLQPGREYKIKGCLKYAGGLSDLESSEMTFTTPDEILLPEKYIYKNLGDSLLLNCSAAVGTDPKFQKDLRWLKANSNTMPMGASSATVASPDDTGFLTASLRIPHINYSHAGAYCCAPEPPVEHFYGKPPSCAEIVLIVNDLTLDHYNLEANPGMSISVTCSTKLKGDLQWIGPDGRILAQVPHSLESNGTAEMQSLRLLLSGVSAESAGDYQCLFQPTKGKRPANQTFSLRLKESVTIKRSEVASGRLRFGDIATLSCVSQDEGLDASRLRWYRYISADVIATTDRLLEVIEATNSSNEATIRIRLAPTSRGRYVCIAFPERVVHLAKENILHSTLLQYVLQYASADIQYHSDVEISSPIKFDNGSAILLRCVGYPSSVNERLEWVFKEPTQNIAYVFGEHDKSSFAITGQKRIAHVMNCFRIKVINDTASRQGGELHYPQSANRELYSKDEIDIIALAKFKEDPMCQAALGQLICRYQRSNMSSSTSSSSNFHSVLLPELGVHPGGLRSSSRYAEAPISLEAIRDAFNGDGLRESASRQAAEPNGSFSLHQSQLLTCLLLLILSRTLFCV